MHVVKTTIATETKTAISPTMTANPHITNPSAASHHVEQVPTPKATPAPTKTEKVYVGSRKSDKYHKASCHSAHRIKPANKVWFGSREDAETHGYVPCQNCNP